CPHLEQRTPGMSPPSGTALLQAFDDRGDPLTEADAHRLQTEALVGPLELVQQRGHELGAGATERMTERDGAPVDVDAAHVWMQLALPRQDDRRERLADLDEIDLLELHAGLAQYALGRRNRTGEHDRRVHTGQ